MVTQRDISNVFREAAVKTDVLCLGEFHFQRAPIELMIRNMDALRDAGYKHIGSEHFPRVYQYDLDQFFLHGKLSKTLTSALNQDSFHLAIREIDPSLVYFGAVNSSQSFAQAINRHHMKGTPLPHLPEKLRIFHDPEFRKLVLDHPFSTRSLLESARENGIRVRGLNSISDVLTTMLGLANPAEAENAILGRLKRFNNGAVSRAKRVLPDGKILIHSGAMHTTTAHEITGIAQALNGHAIGVFDGAQNVIIPNGKLVIRDALASAEILFDHIIQFTPTRIKGIPHTNPIQQAAQIDQMMIQNPISGATHKIHFAGVQRPAMPISEVKSTAGKMAQEIKNTLPKSLTWFEKLPNSGRVTIVASSIAAIGAAIYFTRQHYKQKEHARAQEGLAAKALV